MGTILLVEDDPANARALREALERRGESVVHAANGCEALERASRGRFDLILLDLMLPGRCGFEVLQALRGRGDRTPVILLSSADRPEDRVEGLRLGADDFLAKPVSLRELLARITARRRTARRIDALDAALQAVRAGGGLEHTLATLVERALALTGAERGLVLLAGPDGRLRVELARDREGRALPTEERHSTSVVRRVFASGKAAALLDAEGDAAWSGGSIRDLRLRQVLCAPLRARQEVIGVLYVDSSVQVSDGFQRDELDLFETLASQCGAVVERERLQAMEREIDEARVFQRSMLPSGPLRDRAIEVAGLQRPGGIASGDYYDYLPLGGDRLAVIVGDACGHGLPAALPMAAARSLIRTFVPRCDDPAEALGEVNRALVRDLPEGSFMSLFLAEVDLASGALRHASAGHGPGLLLRSSGDIEELGPTGPALGILADAAYACHDGTPPLEPDDLLLLFTDGLPEAMGPGRELYGVDRLRAALSGAAGEHASTVVERVAESVARWGGRSRLADDCSVVAVRATRACRLDTSSLHAPR